MTQSLNGILNDPWRLLEIALDGPLHPGGIDATENLLDRADVDSTTHLLDVGCGAGDALKLAHERGADAVGLDRNPSHSRAVRGDMSSLPFRNESFDVVLGECVLCLSADLGQTLAEIRRILAPSGRLALSDITVNGTPPELLTPIDEILCLNNACERGDLRGEITNESFEKENIQDHRHNLLAMRDRLTDNLDFERLASALGDQGEQFSEGAKKLETAVESGRVGYISMVATPHTKDSVR